jgi:hypothetical protein
VSNHSKRTKKRATRRDRRPIPPDERVAPLVAATPEEMVMAGNQPHRTLLHDYTLEDLGLDVLRVVPAEHL